MDRNQVTRRAFACMLAGGTFAIASAWGADDADTRPEREGPFAFGVLADAQYCDAEPAGTRYYRASTMKLAKCVEVFNKADLAFVIHLGDFIDRDFESYDVIMPIHQRLKAAHYHLLGNHDFSVAQGRIEDVPARLGLKDRYYQFRTTGWRFLVLDGNDWSLGGRRKGSRQHEKAQSLYEALKRKNAPNAVTWNGALGEEQLAWLDQQLKEADEVAEKVVVFCHFPVYPANVHNLWNDEKVISILESHSCVAAYMNGHNHAGNYGRRNRIHYVTFPGMVETQDTTAYAVVEVRPGSLRIVGHGRTPSRLLKY